MCVCALYTRRLGPVQNIINSIIMGHETASYVLPYCGRFDTSTF